MLIKNWKQEIFTIPNILTLLRIILIPVYLNLYLCAEKPLHYYLAGVILAFSCLTDLIDGFIARQFHMVTTLGKVLDPLADKTTQLSLIFCLSARYPELNPVLILLVIKEIFQIAACLISFSRGQVLPGALPAGKLCTTVLFISMILLVMCPDVSSNEIRILASVDFLFLFTSFISYIFAYFGKNKKTERYRTA